MADPPETFRSSGAPVFGAITVVVALALAVLAAVHPRADAPAWLSVALVLLAVVVHVAQIRPAVQLTEAELVLRNMLSSVHIPWAAVEEVRVRQFLTVRAAGRDHRCAAVGRSRRQIYRDARQLVVEKPSDVSFGGLVETKIRNRAADARARSGVAEESSEQDAPADDVRREPAWLEIGGLAVTAVALAVTLLV